MKIFKNKVIRTTLSIALSIVIVAALTGASFSTYVVEIVDNNQSTLLYTSHSEIDDILKSQGIVIGANDEVTSSELGKQRGKIEILRAFDVTLVADGKTHNLRMSSGTVADALARASITVNDDDLINVSLSEYVIPNSYIQINRVSYNENIVTEVIPNEIKKIPTKALSVGTTSVAIKGAEGEKQTRYMQTVIDGVVVENRFLESKVTKVPKQSTIFIGDKKGPSSILMPPSSLKLDKNGNPANYKQKLVGKATAYSALGKHTKLRPGNVAMDLSRFPKGTQLYIKTPNGSYVYGYSEVRDTGIAVSDGSVLVDLFFNTYNESVQFGSKNVEVYIL